MDRDPDMDSWYNSCVFLLYNICQNSGDEWWYGGLFFFFLCEGWLHSICTQIKEVEQLQKLCQSVCKNPTGRLGALYVQMGPESEICLLLGEKGAWFDKITAESCWLAWLRRHLCILCKKLTIILSLSASHISPLGVVQFLHVLCPLWGTCCLCSPGSAPGVFLSHSVLQGPCKEWAGRRPACHSAFAHALKGPQGI